MSETRWKTGLETLDADVVAVLTGPVIHVRFEVDLEPCAPLLADGLTWTPVILKAGALAAMAAPDLHRMHGTWRVLEPAACDVGVSVAGEGLLAPVVVLPAVDRMPLGEIAGLLAERAAVARAEEARSHALVNAVIPWFPFPWLRRALVRWLFSSPARRRRMVGSLQVTNIGLSDADIAYVPMTAELLLVVGAIRTVDGRRRVTLGIQASHLKLNAVTVRPFLRRFREVIAQPELLR
ncbi:MAG: hypothetical protein H6732_15135 [Alphaproteobacteria bacterium]|nr:hypothetical protein [Alphaproteobacteria bacterium]